MKTLRRSLISRALSAAAIFALAAASSSLAVSPASPARNQVPAQVSARQDSANQPSRTEQVSADKNGVADKPAPSRPVVNPNHNVPDANVELIRLPEGQVSLLPRQDEANGSLEKASPTLVIADNDTSGR